MGATIAFGVSLGACILFLVFKIFEESRSIALYRSIRHKGDVVVLRVANRIREYVARIEHQLSLKNVFVTTVRYAAVSIARGARRVEERAYDVTRRMSRNGNSRATKSSFLQEVSTHKQSLDTERVRRETSLTEDK